MRHVIELTVHLQLDILGQRVGNERYTTDVPDVPFLVWNDQTKCGTSFLWQISSLQLAAKPIFLQNSNWLPRPAKPMIYINQ